MAMAVCDIFGCDYNFTNEYKDLTITMRSENAKLFQPDTNIAIN